MNDETGGRRGLRRMWSPRTGLLAFLAGIVLLTVACGGTSASSSDSATTSGTAGSGTSSASSASPAAGASTAGQSSSYQQDITMAQCMRAHGVPSWPDPSANGTFNLTDVPGIGHYGQLDSPQIQAAEQACNYLGPSGSNSSQQQQLQQLLDQELKFAACMRSHGEPQFPDPTIISGVVTMQIKGLHYQSPYFQAVYRTCQHLLPVVTPTGPGGSS